MIQGKNIKMRWWGSALLKMVFFILKIDYINFFFYYNFHFTFRLHPMEDRKQQIKQYLALNVNPIIEPMLKKVAAEKPKDVLAWMNTWITTKMTQREQQTCLSDSDSQKEDEQFFKKMQQMKSKCKKKNSRQAISAECFGIFNKKSQFTPKMIKKSASTSQMLRNLLQSTIVFKCLQKNDLTNVINSLEQIQAQTGVTIIKQGDEGDMLFIVCSGQYECSKVINGQAKYLKTYHTGEAFGQLSLMYNAPRQATIKCSKDGVLYGLDRQTFINIVQGAAMKKRQSINDCISKVGILADIQPYEKQQLCDALKCQQFETGDYVVRQGQTGDRFYLIEDGCLIAQKKQTPLSEVKKVFEYQSGDYFGQIALIKNTVRQASIKAETHCRLFSIDRDSFKRLLGPIEDILMRNMERYKKYLDQ